MYFVKIVFVVVAGQVCGLLWSFRWLVEHRLSYFNWNHFLNLQKGNTA